MQAVLLPPVAHGLAHGAAQDADGPQGIQHRLRPEGLDQRDDLDDPGGPDDRRVILWLRRGGIRLNWRHIAP